MNASSEPSPGAGASDSNALGALSDSERLLVACLQALARNVAERTHCMSERDSGRHVDEALFELRQSLGPVSDYFAAETERYLRQIIARAQAL